MKTAVLGLAIALLAGAPALAAETLTVPFTTPDGAISAGSYAGTVRITVWGYGESDATALNDAFYVFNGNDDDPPYYQLTFGKTALVPLDPAQDAVNFIEGGRPTYSPNHVYSFLLDTGPTLAQLHFGVGDGIFSDNKGAFGLAINAPEPSTWALLFAGVTMSGAALRMSRKKAQTAAV
ncbi:MAG TPA: PEP-CTERM sorting domain-containing protein [Caulobacteraceae bacterium]|jgi:hypothetical protein